MSIIQIIFLIYQFKRIYNDNKCYFYKDFYNCGADGDTTYKDQWDDFCFQTPFKGGTTDPVYRDSYQDMHYLVGYAKQEYYSNRTICNVSVYTRVNKKKVFLGTQHELLYTFGDIEQSTNYILIYKDNHSYIDGLNVSVRIVKKGETNTLYQLILEKEYFLWNVPKVNYDNATVNSYGQKGAIVELFGWPYEDIIEEADFLKLTGYLGVKISPPNEHVVTDSWIETNGLNPWEYFVQPVSYKFKSRFGDKEYLIYFINECRKKGIRVYSQVVINHMTHQGNDIYRYHYDNPNDCGEPNPHWPGKNASAGSPYFTVKGRTDVEGKYNLYADKTPIFEYPSVPYCGHDFKCRKRADNLDAFFDGWIVGATDNEPSLQELNTGSDYVRQRIADFLTEIISVGITGFSVYYGKYIDPDDLDII